MIELPEAHVIAQQMNTELKGKHIQAGNRGNATHKFAFNTGTSEEYAAIFKDKTIGEVTSHGGAILASIDPGYTLVLGGGGERILLHQSEKTFPKKYHLWLHFQDGAALTVSVQGWGNTVLLPQTEVANHMHVQLHRISPLSDVFTLPYFLQQFDDLDPDSKASLKYFIITKPGVWGIGNGCLQDILFHAKLHPRRRAVDTTETERARLYTSIRETLTQMIEQGGRNSERDLYNNYGGYSRILHSKTKGQPCPECKTPIEKKQYLGGAIYYCPTCQT